MKVTIKDASKTFKPITLEIEIESKSELEALLVRFNPTMRQLLIAVPNVKFHGSEMSGAGLEGADQSHNIFAELKKVWNNL